MSQMRIELEKHPGIFILAAAPALTDDSARMALSEFNESPALVEVLRRFALVTPSGDEWSLDEDLRAAALQRASDVPDRWHDIHSYYYGKALRGASESDPLYQVCGPGLAYHGLEVDPDIGLAAYRDVAHIDLLQVSLMTQQLAREQVSRGRLSSSNVVVQFVEGMALYRLGATSRSIPLLRAVAASDEISREAAVAQHLVGLWDCMREGRSAQPEAARLLQASHKNAIRRDDRRHLAHVKHSMALCLLRTERGSTKRALVLLRESLALTQELGDDFGQAKVLHTLGQALGREPSTLPEAKRALKRSLQLGQELGFRWHQASVLRSMARLEQRGPVRAQLLSQADNLVPNSRRMPADELASQGNSGIWTRRGWSNKNRTGGRQGSKSPRQRRGRT